MKINVMQILLLISFLWGCRGPSASPTNDVLVVAHRGDWRSFPENSLEAIQSAIDMGVDVVEIDLQMTKDSVIVLMHDKKLDRTTNGKGYVSDWTYDSITTLGLINGVGRITDYRIPTLEQALELIKGRVLVNLDKCYDEFPAVYKVIKRTGTESQVIMKSNKSFAEVKRDLGPYLEDIRYMPVVSLDKAEAWQTLVTFRDSMNTWGYELIFSSDTSRVLTRLNELGEGRHLWVNSLWASLCGGMEDDKAVTDPEGNWGKLIRMGFTVVQTDRPALFMKLLRNKSEKGYGPITGSDNLSQKN